MTKSKECARDCSKPLLSSRESMSVPVYSPYGGKEVVETGGGRCLNGILVSGRSCGPSCGAAWDFDSEVMFTIRSSVWVNFVLFFAKLYAFVISGSLAVLASLVDSTIDLLGQGALVWASHVAAKKSEEEYPVGRGRLEPVGVMICAVVMGMASIEVISTSVMRLLQYWGTDKTPAVVLSDSTAALLVGIILLKAMLYVWCRRVAVRHPQNDAVKAIAQDNANDVISNLAALFAPAAASLGPSFWTVDPLAGIVISVYIVYTWLRTGFEQVEMIVGKRADTDFVRTVMSVAQLHDSRMQLDQLNAYHFGPKYLVELEVVMPEYTTLRESHDAGIALQHKIEMLDEVERCFVHIDYQLRPHDDHDPKVPIEEKLYGGPCRDSPRAAHTKSGLSGASAPSGASGASESGPEP